MATDDVLGLFCLIGLVVMTVMEVVGKLLGFSVFTN